MNKVLFLFALGLIFLSSCNNNSTKKTVEQVDSIALRAKTDTVLSFNGYTLGDTVAVQEDPWGVGGIGDSLCLPTKHESLVVGGHDVFGDCLMSAQLCENNKGVIGEIHLCFSQDTCVVKEIVKLYESRYGKFSYYMDCAYAPVIFPSDKVDSQSHDFYLEKFLRQGWKITWEWANSSISMYNFNNEVFRIEYKASGYASRMKEEKEQKLKAKQQDI